MQQQTSLFDLLGGSPSIDIKKGWESVKNRLPPYPRLFFHHCADLSTVIGNEFHIILHNPGDRQKAYDYLQQLRSALNEVFLVNSFVKFQIKPPAPAPSDPNLNLGIGFAKSITLDHPKQRFLVELASYELSQIAWAKSPEINQTLQARFKFPYYSLFYSLDPLETLAKLSNENHRSNF